MEKDKQQPTLQGKTRGIPQHFLATLICLRLRKGCESQVAIDRCHNVQFLARNHSHPYDNCHSILLTLQDFEGITQKSSALVSCVCSFLVSFRICSLSSSQFARTYVGTFAYSVLRHNSTLASLHRLDSTFLLSRVFNVNNYRLHLAKKEKN